MGHVDDRSGPRTGSLQDRHPERQSSAGAEPDRRLALPTTDFASTTWPQNRERLRLRLAEMSLRHGLVTMHEL